jgi:aspartate/methionine/tyrosine aminotransferase
MAQPPFSNRTNWNLSPNRLSQALARHRAEGKAPLDLTASNPTQCGFHYDQKAILQALSSPASIVYQPEPKGLEIARRAVAEYYAAWGEQVSPDDIFLTTSTSEAYSFVFRTLCNPGDELLVPAPSYPLLGFLGDLQDVQLVHYPLCCDPAWRIDFTSLESAITQRTRGIVVVHPNNPTGHYCKPDEVARLNALCSARGLALIADEVFLDFSLDGKRQASFASNNAPLTFTLSGLSKIAGLPQMKAAWLAVGGPPAEKSRALARLEVIADTFLSMNAPVQHAIPVFFEQRRAFQEQLMRRVRVNLAELDRQLVARSKIARLPVEGGWYAVLRVPATHPDEEFAVALLEKQNVYVHPGHFYDFPADGCLVVSLIALEHDFSEGLRRLLSFFSP